MQRLLNENEDLEREIEELNNELNSVLNRDSKPKKLKVGGTLKRGVFKKKKGKGVALKPAEGSVKTYKKTKELFDTFLSGDKEAIQRGAGLLQKLKNPKKYHIDSQDSFGETILMHAVRKNDGSLVEWLLKKGASVNHQDLEGETALMIAAKLGSYELASMLLEKMDERKELKRGIDLVMVNSRKTALMQASEKGNTRICSLLLQNGANPEKIDLDGKTARELAKENDHKKAAKALAPKKKNRDEDDDDDDDDDDYDILSEASSDVSNLDEVVDGGKGYKRLSYTNDATMAEVKGENERLKDEVKRLKFEIESAKGKRKPDEWQQIKNLDPDSRAKLLSTDNRPEKIKNLINEFHDLILEDKWEKAESKFLVAKNPKITINVPDSYGETALMKAARVGNFDSLELLLTYSAKPNVRDNNGDTALMKAAMHNKMQCAEALIDAGADMNHHTKHKRQTALMLAALRGHQEMCELLITRGCNPFASDSDGQLAKDLALNDETREYLEEIDEQLKSKRHSTDPEVFT